MPENVRRFQAGPDPLGRIWEVELRWLQTAVSIRHSDSVDVKFALSSGGERREVVVALQHADLLKLESETARPLTDARSTRLAALHLRRAIETGADLEKTLMQVSYDDLRRYDGQPAS